MRSIIPMESNPVLREHARPLSVNEIKTAEVRTLIREMKQLLAQENNGVALAAPQVGESIRLFIVSGRALTRRRDEGTDDSDAAAMQDEVYINPKIVKISKAKKDKHEGCLSIRGQWGMVPRAEKVTLRALDENGKSVERGASGFLAHIFQHEMDHLEAILYTDRATELYDEDPEENA